MLVKQMVSWYGKHAFYIIFQELSFGEGAEHKLVLTSSGFHESGWASWYIAFLYTQCAAVKMCFAHGRQEHCKGQTHLLLMYRFPVGSFLSRDCLKHMHICVWVCGCMCVHPFSRRILDCRQQSENRGWECFVENSWSGVRTRWSKWFSHHCLLDCFTGSNQIWAVGALILPYLHWQPLHHHCRPGFVSCEHRMPCPLIASIIQSHSAWLYLSASVVIFFPCI